MRHHRSRPTLRSLGAALALASIVAVGAVAGPASATPLTISGSMEGNLPIHSGDLVKAGYDFTMPGGHPAATVHVTGAKFAMTAVCKDGSTSTLTINVPDAVYSVPANATGWFPSGDQHSPLVYQGSITVPATLCGGAGAHVPRGVSFSSNFTSTDTTDPVHVRMHYADNTSGSWSGTASIVPSPPPSVGYMQICKSSTKIVAGTAFKFSVAGNTITVPVGQCSAIFQAPIGNVTVTELATAGVRMQSLSTSPTARLVSFDLSKLTATVKVVAGDSSTRVRVNVDNETIPSGS